MTFPDQRSGELLLVAHRVVNLALAGRGRRDGSVAVHAVTSWASRRGAGVYQLPLPHFHLARTAAGAGAAGAGGGPAGGAATEADPAARDHDAQRLEFVFGQLDVYRAGGYSVIGAVAIAEDLGDPRETEWWELFAEIAQRHGWEQLRVLTVPLDAAEFDGAGFSGTGIAGGEPGSST